MNRFNKVYIRLEGDIQILQLFLDHEIDLSLVEYRSLNSGGSSVSMVVTLVILMIRRPLGKWLTECLKVWSFDDFVGPRPLDAGGSNAKKLKRFWYTIAAN